MAAFDAKRTEVAQNAFNFAQYFTSSFEQLRVAGVVPRRPEVVAPEGMSTGGGKAARQSIRLSPEGPGASVLTIGWVELPTLQASLRTYRCLASLHAARFRGRPFDLDRASYDAFLRQAQELLGAVGLHVAFEDDARGSSPDAQRVSRPARPAEPAFMTVAAAVFVGFAVGAVVGGLAVYARFVGF